MLECFHQYAPISLMKSSGIIETACTKKTQHDWKTSRERKGNYPAHEKNCEIDYLKKKVSSHEVITLIICLLPLCLAEVGLVSFPVDFWVLFWVWVFFFSSFSAFFHTDKQSPREKSYKYLSKRPSFLLKCWNSLQTLVLK